MICEVCNFKFDLTKDIRYTVRENETSGICTVGKNVESQQYDAVDCPRCGCQSIIGKRLRPVKIIVIEEVEEDTTEDEEPQDGQISSPEEGEDFFGIYDECEKDDIADIKKKIKEAGE